MAFPEIGKDWGSGSDSGDFATQAMSGDNLGLGGDTSVLRMDFRDAANRPRTAPHSKEACGLKC